MRHCSRLFSQSRRVPVSPCTGNSMTSQLKVVLGYQQAAVSNFGVSLSCIAWSQAWLSPACLTCYLRTNCIFSGWQAVRAEPSSYCISRGSHLTHCGSGKALTGEIAQLTNDQPSWQELICSTAYGQCHCVLHSCQSPPSCATPNQALTGNNGWHWKTYTFCGASIAAQANTQAQKN